MGGALQGDAGSLLFLGTGCAEPSKHRGSSGIHLRLHGGRGALIDAGEGVHGQLVRHYGRALAQEQVSPPAADAVLGRSKRCVCRTSQIPGTRQCVCICSGAPVE